MTEEMGNIDNAIEASQKTVVSREKETGEDADDRIVQILEKLAGERNKCVVSDDNFVRNHARAYQANPISLAPF